MKVSGNVIVECNKVNIGIFLAAYSHTVAKLVKIVFIATCVLIMHGLCYKTGSRKLITWARCVCLRIPVVPDVLWGTIV